LNKHIVLPEGIDPRILEAASEAQHMGLANITVLGDPDTISQVVLDSNLDLSSINIINPSHSSNTEVYAESLYQARKQKGMTIQEASAQITDPIIYAAMMVRTGDADGAVAGAITATSDVVRTALQLIGKHSDYELVSSCFIMLMDKPFHTIKGAFIFADCALNIDPTTDQLAQIALASSNTAKVLLDVNPQVAMLSFSTNHSADHPLVDKVVKATEQLKQLAPNLNIIGEVQIDAALIPDIYQQKVKGAKPVEPANVLVFPNIEAGNIGYKLTERLAQAEAIGPVLQGLKKPFNDLSRGCKVSDITRVIAITALQAC